MVVGNQSKPASPFWGCAGVREHWISPFRGSCECGAVGRLLISKEQYYKVLLIHIENYRAFLKGEDEVVNSKDLYQTLNTRYVYLPYLQELVKQENLQHSFSCFELQKEIQRKINQNRSIGICKRIIWESRICTEIRIISRRWNTTCSNAIYRIKKNVTRLKIHFTIRLNIFLKSRQR